MSDTYDRSKFKETGEMEDHRCTHYVENLVKILEKQHKTEIYAEENDTKTICLFKHLFIPTESFEKQVSSASCKLKTGCDQFCNKYSVKVEEPRNLFAKRSIVICICCQNAEFVYKGTLRLDGNSSEYVDIKVERSNERPHTIELDFQLPRNKFKETSATLILQTHFEEALLKIYISEADLIQKA